MNRNLRWLKDLDLFLIFVIAAICCMSLLAVSSATHTIPGGSKPFVIKQMVWMLIGFSVMIWFMKLDLRLIVRNLEIAYWINIVLLVLVFFTHPINGAHAWISLPGGIALEPSEFFKVIFVLMLAKYLANEQEDDNGKRRENWKSYMLIIAYGILGLALILKEPELGQTLMILSALVVVLFVHLPPKWFWGFFLTGAAAIFAFYFFCFAYQNQTLHFLEGLVNKHVLAEHQFQRFQTFIHPEDDLAGEGYQVYEAKVAIGSGQLFGKGLYHGSQTQGNWVPEQQTDFIFSVIGEELGFVGSVVLVFLYFLMLYRIVMNGLKSPDRTGMYITTMVAGMFAFQIFENIGMSLQLMPMTGVTLPFISYGGSSILTNCMLMGIVLNVRYRRRKIRF